MWAWAATIEAEGNRNRDHMSQIAEQHGGGWDGFDWESVWSNHARWLRSVIAARIGNSHGIDDVLQEVAVAAVVGVGSLRDPTKIAPWLYQLAVRQSLMYRRKMGRQRRLLSRYGDHERQGRCEPDPLQWILQQERGELVRRSLQHMHRRDREILMLKYGENWTYQQMAAHLGLSVSAVEARLHRARVRLREMLSRATDTN